eukprot:scaffold110165_cov67-Cyclotella_meneghiniana.AAC.2
MRLNERHLDGEKVEFGSGAKIATDCLLGGINMQDTEDQLYFCSRYFMSLIATPSPIKDMVAGSIPTEIFTRHGDTKESLAERYNACEWLDPIHVHRQGETLVNGDSNYKCPMRRTLSVSKGPPHTIEDKEAEDCGRSVVTMFTYACHEMPVTRWTSRVISKLHYALMLECWADAWPYLTKPSREGPPR